jgi:hypothetical protein
MEATVTDLAEARLIVLADYANARRKRARHFFGTMGVVLRFEDRRGPSADSRIASPAAVPAVRKTAFETRAPRAR